ALGVAAANPIWGPRIQMITFALGALTYLWVKAFCEGRSRALYWLPLVMLVWVNLHGGFVLGYGILGLALLVEAARYLIRRPTAMPPSRLRAMAVVLAASVVVAVPALADYAQQAFERIKVRWRRRVPRTTPVTFAANVVMIVLVLAIVAVASLPSLLQRVDGKLVARDFPIKAADFLVQHSPPGHMLNVYGWGGYLIYRLGATTPPQPVFIFGDAALDGDQLLRDYDHLQSLGSDQAQLL